MQFLRSNGLLDDPGGDLRRQLAPSRWPGLFAPVTVPAPSRSIRSALDFFDGFEWQLEHAGGSPDRALGPDILGHVFATFVDRAQTAAYYTRTDITEYIARTTLVPWMLDRARARCPAALEPAAGHSVWDLLRNDPDRYIHAAVRHGADCPLPAAVARGVSPTTLHHPVRPGPVQTLVRRVRWNEPAASEYGLSGESWRDVAARRDRYAAVRRQLAAGGIRSANDLVTLNVDLQRFTLDLIERCASPELLRALGQALDDATVLDPTCGSGELLLVAIRELAPLREACQGRMDAFAEEGLPFDGVTAGASEPRLRGASAVGHIVESNLFGVDLVPEAVEACKLRLALEVAAKLSPGPRHAALIAGLAPHVKAGNALVGSAVESPPAAGEPLTPRRAADTEASRPFHWPVEFPAVLRRGVFDVVLANPPYLEASKARGYAVRGYRTQRCANLYAYTVEQSLALLAPEGRLGVIVPISIACSGAFRPLRETLLASSRSLWLAHFSNRPGQLFPGAQNRLSIVLTSGRQERPSVHATRYGRWDPAAGERAWLFFTLAYEVAQRPSTLDARWLKLGSQVAAQALGKLRRGATLEAATSRKGPHRVHWVRVPGYFCPFLRSPPLARPESGGPDRARGEVNQLGFDDEQTCCLAHAVLNSSTYYLFFCVHADTRHVNPSDVRAFPIDVAAFSAETNAELVQLSRRLTESYRVGTLRRRKSGLLVDSIDARASNPILDEIDGVLARHFGMTEEELDYVIHYDFKYRMGRRKGAARR